MVRSAAVRRRRVAHAMAALVAPLAPPAFTTKALTLRSSLPGSAVQTHATSTHYVYAGKNVL
jgi:hypothetical protein